jgi:integrase
VDLSRKRERDRLAPRKEPYWQRLGKGAYLGVYRSPGTGNESWHARFRTRDGKQLKNPLGEALEFDDAKKKAEEWLSQLAGSPVRTVKRGTVRAALEAYLADLRRHGRADAATEAEARFKLTVWGDDVETLNLESATRDDFLEWRDRLMEGRQPRSVNRQVRSVVAGLNRANALGHVGNPAAWKLAPLQDDMEDEAEPIFLTPDQRKSLLDNASAAPATFLKGIEHTGARPKELAGAKASDFDGKMLRLAHRKGRPPKLRVRHVVLSASAIDFFKAQTKDKLPSAWIFTEDGEQPWRRHVWAREVRAAIAGANKSLKGKARIPVGASAYSFRHARISELLQVHHVDPLTVAAQTGTSLAMIERNYFKFIPSAMEEKLAAVR